MNTWNLNIVFWIYNILKQTFFGYYAIRPKRFLSHIDPNMLHLNQRIFDLENQPDSSN